MFLENLLNPKEGRKEAKRKERTHWKNRKEIADDSSKSNHLDITLNINDLDTLQETTETVTLDKRARNNMMP